MSAGLQAIFPHRFASAEDVLRLPEIMLPLAAEATVFERACGRSSSDEIWRWGWYQEEATPQQDWVKYRCAWLDGPGALTIGVGTGSLFVYPGAKWHWARAERQILNAATSLFNVAAQALRAQAYLCTHDEDTSGDVMDGLTVAETEEKLKARGYVHVETMGDLWVPSTDDDHYTHDVYCCVRM